MKQLPPNPNLIDFQKHIKTICEERGWDKNSTTEKFLLFVEEVGELARAIRDVGGVSSKYATKGRETRELEEEFADVFNYLLDLANHFDIDLEKAYRTKSKKNEKRTWS